VIHLYRWCSVTGQFSIRWLSTSHLYPSKWKYLHSKVCFLH